jgi:endonuclease YncB( thermonuclease family)
MIRVLAILLALSSPAGAEPIMGRASVIDGDTIEIHGQRIRLSGIDAPESSQHCRDRSTGATILCGGQASMALADLIGASVVTCRQDGTDVYRRVLAHCAARGADLGDAMVRAGWALSFVRYSHEYDGAEAAARAAGRGLWGMEFGEPWEWRRAQRSR